MNNSKIKSGDWFGKPLFLCGYSFSGFIENCEERKLAKKKFDYIHDHCKDWGFFGDGLCFSCHCIEDECHFDKINWDFLTNCPNENPADKIDWDNLTNNLTDNSK